MPRTLSFMSTMWMGEVRATLLALSLLTCCLLRSDPWEGVRGQLLHLATGSTAPSPDKDCAGSDCGGGVSGGGGVGPAPPPSPAATVADHGAALCIMARLVYIPPARQLGARAVAADEYV